MALAMTTKHIPIRSYFIELRQEHRTAETLLHNIVHSKRLLADHIELLESCNVPENNSISMTTPSNCFTFLRTVGLWSMSALTYSLRDRCWPALYYIVSTTAAVYGSVYTIKSFFTLKRLQLERRLHTLIADLNGVDSEIRKNICYLRETSFLRGISKEKCDNSEAVQNCIQSIIKLVKLIYEEVQSLEAIRLPVNIEAKYQPLEDLKDCIYFQRDVSQFGASDIKDFFNIFLYFQSQLLIRLCLLIVYRSDDAYSYLHQRMHTLGSSIRVERDRLSESVSFSSGQTLLREKLQALKAVDRSTAIDSLALTKVKRGSLDLMCRLIAMTNEYRDTDNCIQSFTGDHRLKKDVFMDIARRMTQIEYSLVASQEDYRRLKLLYDKFLFTTFRIKPERKSISNAEAEKCAVASSDVDIVTSNEPQNENENDDFFAIRDEQHASDDDGDAVFGSQKRGNFDDELEQLDVNVSRSYFAPVLKQLKSKINPINDAMRERELKFLMAKGFDRDRIVDSAAAAGNVNDENAINSDSDSDVPMPRSKPRNNYDEMRTFLQEKQQFAMIPPAMLPTHAPGDEDVLE